MKDQEFSRLREEFASTGREFSPPAREFTPPAQEYHKAGAEFSQSPAPVGKKKKSVNPLMLTTAAVVTAAVVLGGVNAPVEDKIPEWPLEAAHQEYLDECLSSLEAHDFDRLIELADDPRIHELLMDEFPAYKDLLDTKYGIDSWETHALYRNYGEDEAEYWTNTRDSHFIYTGDSVCPLASNDSYGSTCDLSYTFASYNDFYTHINMTDFQEWSSCDEPYKGYSFTCEKYPNGSVSWQFHDTLVQEVETEYGGDIKTISGIRIQYNNFSSGYTQEVLEGDFECVQVFVEDESCDPYLEPRLFNGTITYYHSDSLQTYEPIVIEVVDGYIQMNEYLSIEPIQMHEGGTGYMLTIRKDNFHNSFLLYPIEGEDILYLSINAW